MFLDAPRGLGDPARLSERRDMLKTAPAVQPLNAWLSGLQSERAGIACPDFDPAEAGVAARLLFLAEAPGPMSHTENGTRRPGTGFISVDNPDQTAVNCWTVRRNAGIGQDVALHWNIVPWYLGPASKKPDASELNAGAQALRSLLPLLPQLRVVVLAGLYAQNGWTKHMTTTSDLTVIRVPHPSPLAMAQPGKREQFIQGMADASRMLM